MSWILKTFSSTIGQKVLVALTGLFLSLFLVIHLSGNLQLLIDDDGFAFNRYTAFMMGNPLIKVAGYITYFSILFHAFKGLALAYKNSQARKQGYKKTAGNANSTWMSRSMGVLGTLIFVFIVVHMQQFWYQAKVAKSLETEDYTTFIAKEDQSFRVLSGTEIKAIDSSLKVIAAKYEEQGTPEAMEQDPEYLKYKTLIDDFNYSREKGKIENVTYKNMYIVVRTVFKDPLYLVFYLLSMFAIAFHLLHGFTSAFQTLGFNYSKYNGLIKGLGYFVSILIPAGFALLPIYIFFN